MTFPVNSISSPLLMLTMDLKNVANDRPAKCSSNPKSGNYKRNCFWLHLFFLD